MATDFEISTGTLAVPTAGDRMLLCRLVLGVWTPYAALYESSLAPLGPYAGTSLLSARSDHLHSAYVPKVAGATPGNIAIITSDGSIADGGSPTSQYVLPAASISTRGGVKQGAGVSIALDGTLSASLLPASPSTLGGVKPGAGLSITGDGTLSATAVAATPVRNVYTASGAIAPASTLAVLNGTSGTLAMTLAAGTTDGQGMLIKLLGAADATVAATIDGASQSVALTASASGTIKDALRIKWSSPDASWLVE